MTSVPPSAHLVDEQSDLVGCPNGRDAMSQGQTQIAPVGAESAFGRQTPAVLKVDQLNVCARLAVR